MNHYPIIANCNFESQDGALGQAIHKARLAVEAGQTDDADLVAALDELEETLARHADDGCVSAVNVCCDAEQAVADAWTDDVQGAAEAVKQSRYVD